MGAPLSLATDLAPLPPPARSTVSLFLLEGCGWGCLDTALPDFRVHQSVAQILDGAKLSYSCVGEHSYF